MVVNWTCVDTTSPIPTPFFCNNISTTGGTGTVWSNAGTVATTVPNVEWYSYDGKNWYVRQSPPWYLHPQTYAASPYWQDLSPLYPPAAAPAYRNVAPAILSDRERKRREAQRDQSLYEQAVREHNVQEAERIGRLIEARERIEAQRLQEIERLRVEQTEQQAAAARDAAERTAQAAAANDRARGLLLEHLTPAQRATVEQNGWFVVEGGMSKKKYRILTNRSAGNIEELASDLFGRDKVSHRLCCHVPYNKQLPLHDHLLAQKVMLELAEDDFLRLANRHAA